MQVLGIDFGAKKTGLALGDSETKIAFPLFVIAGGEAGLVEIKRVVEEEGIQQIIVGLPTTTEANQISNYRTTTLNFIEKLKSELSLPLETIDEQFTSKESRRLQVEEGATAAEDALAAMLILEDYFNS
ncbi:MAG: Holliday junction resolvase RuvX [Patescibacteria group bacterium]